MQGVQRLLDGAHHGQFSRRAAGAEIGLLVQADAVLGRDAAAELADQVVQRGLDAVAITVGGGTVHRDMRSEEHTSELQSQSNLVCRLLLEKKKKPQLKYACE